MNTIHVKQALGKIMAENKGNLIEEIIRDITNNYEDEITNDTKAMTIEGWDSLAQLNIVFAIEAEFDIKIELSDIENFKKVGDFQDFVETNSL